MLWLVSLAQASPAAGECATGVPVSFSAARAREKLASGTPEALQDVLSSLGLKLSFQPGPKGIALDVFRAALHGPEPVDFVVQLRSESLLVGVVLHPLGGSRYCALELPFLPGDPRANGYAWATFGFLQLTDPQRQSVRVEWEIDYPGNTILEEGKTSMWEIRGGRWAELFSASTTSSSGMAGSHSEGLTVTPQGDAFPRELRVDEEITSCGRAEGITWPLGDSASAYESSCRTDSRTTVLRLQGERYQP